jgi:RNA polymerase sigma-70 factor (ECF subfamily)
MSATTSFLAGHDVASFALFYRRHVDAMLGFFSRRTRDAELAADLTAETFAAALAGRAQYKPSSARPRAGCSRSA